MNVIRNTINARSEPFRNNVAAMQALVDDLRAKVARIREGGGAKANERHTSRGKLLPRDRVRALLDPGSPFLELSQLAAWDMYDNQVAATREDAQKFMSGVTTERAKNIIKAAYDFAGSSAKIFTIGWCFGGGWSLQASIEGGEQAAGCIMYYGMPEKDVNRLSSLHCDVLGIFASKDGWITPAVVDEFKENMKKAGKKINVYQYDAEHAFANPSNPKYDKTAAEDAYTKVLTFIKLRRN